MNYPLAEQERFAAVVARYPFTGTRERLSPYTLSGAGEDLQRSQQREAERHPG